MLGAHSCAVSSRMSGIARTPIQHSHRDDQKGRKDLESLLEISIDLMDQKAALRLSAALIASVAIASTCAVFRVRLLSEML
jgi:hypothetical protein